MRSKQIVGDPRIGCAALVLAAGRGRRFGSDKRLARLTDGRTLLAATLARVLQQFDPVLVVLRPEDDAQALGVDTRVRIVRALQADEGMGASLAAGVAALGEMDGDAVAVLLGDMPWIAPQTVDALLAQAGSERVVVPVCDGQRGHPVIFGRVFWGALRQMRGDQGGRQVIAGAGEGCVRVTVEDRGVLLDVDRPGDLGGQA